jgi:hypothetical protein
MVSRSVTDNEEYVRGALTDTSLGGADGLPTLPTGTDGEGIGTDGEGEA